MAKPDLNSNLVPFLIAGILSGSLSATLLRPGGGAKGGGANAASEVESLEASGPSSWVADLHPVLDALSAALSAPGESAEHSAARALVAAAATKTATGDDVLAALETLRTGLDEAESAGVDCGSTGTLISAAGTLGAYLLTTGDGDAKSARYGAAKALLEEYREWRRLAELAERVKDSKEPGSSATYDVDFIIATVPDYVDSNSGWLADENLAAIQSSMVRNNYVLDRPQLVDWSRATARADGLTSTSRLHERQPGALLFRKVDPNPRDHVQLQVVLLVLETPTAGVHHAALRNAAAFVRAWKRCTGESRRVLRVLGPSFSGSTLSLAIVLNEIRRNDSSSFQETWVVSGSATADSNIDTMNAFAPGVHYRATVLTSSILEKRMAAFLEEMNPLWRKGNRVALLIESNTAYGQNRNMTASEASAQPEPARQAFPFAKVFKFPLHVAQLWSEAPETAPSPLFAPGNIVPLNLREAAPPSDQIPALRPALTSAVVASTVEAILDAIRHEQLSAIGIVATDNRDALFLAREVKRSTPDAQIFLFATHALYLHPDYVPYLRGALVASSYSLALANQPETKPWWPGSVREPFQSQSSEGVFNATRTLLTVEDGAVKADGTFSVDYCTPEAPDDSCTRVPQATINVIGEDGYWTLPLAANPQIAGDRPATATGRSLPLLPLRATFAALIVMGIIGLHILMLRRIRNDLRAQVEPSGPRAVSALEWPIVRMFAPPRTVPGAATNHLLALRVCLLFLGLAAAWVVVTTVPFMIGISRVRAGVTGTLALASFALTVVPAWAWCGESKRIADDIWKEDGRAEAPSQMTPVAKALFLTLILTLWSFAAVIAHTLFITASPDAGALLLARYVGGGVVSPAALTLFTLTAVYAALITGLRRLSLVGYGYAHLTAGSPAFSLLTGEKPHDSKDRARPSQFACILDMPAQNLPAPYLSAVVAIAVVAALCLIRTSTFDGMLFTAFLIVSSLAVLAIGLLLLAQGLATWNIARAHLTRLVHSPIEARLASVASYVPWDISLAPPKLTQLMPVARMADGVIREFRRIAGVPPPVVMGSQARRAADSACAFNVAVAAGVPLRKGDLTDLDSLFAAPSHVEELTIEMEERQCAALIQSDSWRSMWKLSDAIVSAMQRSAWQRSGAPAERAPDLDNADSRKQPLTRQSLASLVLSEEPKIPAPRPRPETAWFEQCEQLVALQLAFVLRDIVARTVTCLFAAMLCLTLLTAAHLLYSFNGRNTALTIDMLAVAATAVVSVWILVDMERDHILSRLRTTTPGRVDINWDFFKRIAVYGVLPLLVVIASLFPEVGGTLFGWLEPLRKLSSF